MVTDDERAAIEARAGLATQRDVLLDALKDKDRRHQVASVITTRVLAAQIREMRLARGWTQSELGKKVGMSQGMISLLESPNYSRYSIRTLTRLASVFDVALIVGFRPFSDFIRWVIGLSLDDLAVPAYDDDPGMHRLREVPDGSE